MLDTCPLPAVDIISMFQRLLCLHLQVRNKAEEWLLGWLLYTTPCYWFRLLFLADFQKMKGGLSDHWSVCLFIWRKMGSLWFHCRHILDKDNGHCPGYILNPFSAKPLFCIYAKNATGYLLNLQHWGKRSYPHQFSRSR